MAIDQKNVIRVVDEKNQLTPRPPQAVKYNYEPAQLLVS
jgi:hypothetical protein